VIFPHKITRNAHAVSKECGNEFYSHRKFVAGGETTMKSTRFDCPGEAARLRDRADQLDQLGKPEAAELWRAMADRIEQQRFVDAARTLEDANT
jgi:hypothetical protein